MYFLLIVIAVLSLIYGYTGLRIIPPLVRTTPKRLLLWGFTLVLAYLPLSPVMFRYNGIENRWVDSLAWFGYVDLGFFTLLFVFLFIKDLVLGMSFLVLKGVRWFKSFTDHKSVPVDDQRRAFVGSVVNWGLLGFTGALTGLGVYQVLKRPEVIPVKIPVKGSEWVKTLERLRIVQITDLHVGATIKGDYVERVVEQVNGLAPHIIALTGDLVDGSVAYLKEDVAPLALLSAPMGKYFVTGNHEYYSNVFPWIKVMKQLGFDVLLNEHRILRPGGAGILLAGVTDYRGGRFYSSHISSPEKALQGAGDHDYRILLAHQPRSVFEAERAGYDLQISGHTHGGQYFPGNFLVPLNQPYTAGLHQHGRTMIYVSQGTGYWGPPMRIATRSEITLFELKVS